MNDWIYLICGIFLTWSAYNDYQRKNAIWMLWAAIAIFDYCAFFGAI